MNPHKKLAKQLKKAHTTALLLDNPSASIQLEECAMESCARASDYPDSNKWYEWLRLVIDARKVTDVLISEHKRNWDLVHPELVEYRMLEKGEVVQAGDEYDKCVNPLMDDPVWVPARHSIGTIVSDPAYISHGRFRRRVERSVAPSCGCDKRCDDSCGCDCHAEAKTERLPSVMYKGMFSGQWSLAVQVTQELLDNRDQWPEWMDAAARKPWGEEENALRLYECEPLDARPYVLQIYLGPDADHHPRVALDEWLLQHEDSGRLSVVSQGNLLLQIIED